MPDQRSFRLAEHAKAAILLHANTGEILFEKNPHRRLPPASMTKILTALITMDLIESGKLGWKDRVSVSAYAASIRGSTMRLKQGDSVTVENLLKGMLIASANDASIAMAEHISGSVDRFVKGLNEKARALGLTNTNFVNPNGSPAPNHYSTAFDMAMMARELLEKQGTTTYSGVRSALVRKAGSPPYRLRNTNKLIGVYPGIDGLKTGYTKYAGFCLCASACREHQRVIAVVMGEPTRKQREVETAALLDYAFAASKKSFD
ncbi:D-alanyl-D-alanine carboxypeptidase family protein [Brevibacillus sp. H7]|uniref:D-alanyl-D-alanine carboxypeptidase family protein n=1 Tax=Brevibacillus sp. H7 TaxID=3349138 RepID=UPI0037F841F4